MHGVIFSELKKYVTTRHGADTWTTLLNQAGLGQRSYLSTQQYPDEEVVKLVDTAAKMTGKPAATILRDFGEFLVPDLLAVYKAFVKPDWKALDLLEHVEDTMHRAVRLQNPGAAPPKLVCKRVSPTEVVVTYSSPRKLCALGEGMIKGISDFYKQPLNIQQQSCMLRGGQSCTISAKLAASALAA
jgi:heme-NO-binding protein